MYIRHMRQEIRRGEGEERGSRRQVLGWPVRFLAGDEAVARLLWMWASGAHLRVPEHSHYLVPGLAAWRANGQEERGLPLASLRNQVFQSSLYTATVSLLDS